MEVPALFRALVIQFPYKDNSDAQVGGQRVGPSLYTQTHANVKLTNAETHIDARGHTHTETHF